MKQWILNWLLKDINRFEVINHHTDGYEIGRIVVAKSFKVIIPELQDNNRTLKIFI